MRFVWDIWLKSRPILFKFSRTKTQNNNNNNIEKTVWKKKLPKITSTDFSIPQKLQNLEA